MKVWRNRYNIARVSSINLMNELGRSSTSSLETCVQTCDEKHVFLRMSKLKFHLIRRHQFNNFSFDGRNSLCIIESAYYSIDANDLNTQVFVTIKFVEFQSKFSMKNITSKALIYR